MSLTQHTHYDITPGLSVCRGSGVVVDSTAIIFVSTHVTLYQICRENSRPKRSQQLFLSSFSRTCFDVVIIGDAYEWNTRMARGLACPRREKYVSPLHTQMCLKTTACADGASCVSLEAKADCQLWSSTLPSTWYVVDVLFLVLDSHISAVTEKITGRVQDTCPGVIGDINGRAKKNVGNSRMDIYASEIACEREFYLAVVG